MAQITQTRRWQHVPGRSQPLVCLVVGLSLIVQSGRAADTALEYEVKAAYLLNFTKFIEWPAEAFGAPDSPFAVCILGDDPFGNTLDQTVAGEVVSGRKVVVQRIKDAPAPKLCQMMFISSSEKEALKTLPGLGVGVLTIGEGENFYHDGGMIAFVLEKSRVRFGINVTVAETAGLKLSSKLLNIAISVQK
jgi:hypothetical protein